MNWGMVVRVRKATGQHGRFYLRGIDLLETNNAIATEPKDYFSAYGTIVKNLAGMKCSALAKWVEWGIMGRVTNIITP